MNLDTSFSLENLCVKVNNKVLISIPQLQLPAQQVISIIGPNGAGKSTLIKSLLGHYPCDSLRLFNQDAKSWLNKGKVAWVGQHEQFNLPLTLMDYVLLGRYPHLSWFEKVSDESRQFALELLERFELDGFVNSRIEVLSGGEKQRAAIVRALIQDTQVMLLDEPTNHLDIRHQHLLMSYLQQEQQRSQKIIIMVLHDLSLAANYSDYIVLMTDGGILAQGDVETVMTEDNLTQAYHWPIKPFKQDAGIWAFNSFAGV